MVFEGFEDSHQEKLTQLLESDYFWRGVQRYVAVYFEINRWLAGRFFLMPLPETLLNGSKLLRIEDLL